MQIGSKWEEGHVENPAIPEVTRGRILKLRAQGMSYQWIAEKLVT